MSNATVPLNIFSFRRQLVDDHAGYTRGFIHIREPRLREFVDRQLDDGSSSSPGPVTVSDVQTAPWMARCSWNCFFARSIPSCTVEMGTVRPSAGLGFASRGVI
jgi:hypothetical protein